MYHSESAGNPNMPMTIIKYNKSNKDRMTSNFRNVCVKFDVLRFEINTTTLKILPNTPMHETICFQGQPIH